MSNSIISQKQLITWLDYGGLVNLGYEQGELYGEERIKRYVELCRDAGLTKLYWRVSIAGQVDYHSQVRTVFNAIGLVKPGHVGHTPLPLILRQCDPLEVAVRHGHACGLEVYPYVTLFDEYYPGCESDFEKAHQEYDWLSRDGKEWVRGLYSYAYPEVREHRLAEAKELCQYGADGLFLDVARTHSHSWRVSQPYTEFGFNQPEVEAFQEEFGVDVRHEPYEDEAWQQFRGRHLTIFLQEVRAEVEKAGMKLGVGLYTRSGNPYNPGQHCRPQLGRFHLDWRTWVEEGIIDEVALIGGHYLERTTMDDWEEAAEAEYREVTRRQGCEVYQWIEPRGKEPEGFVEHMRGAPEETVGEDPPFTEEDRETIRRETVRALRSSADGISFFEGRLLEQFDLWDTIHAARAEAGLLM